jgi:hypothetical protein
MNVFIRRLTTSVAVLAVTVLATSPAPASAQLGGLRDALGKAATKAPNLTDILQKDPPITTDLGDAVWSVDSLDNFWAVDSLDNFRGIDVKSMTDLRRTPTGGFILQAGAYTFDAQSYCLKAGTYGPGGGDGYLYAPLDGPADNAVLSIARNSYLNPDIPQRDIQVLLWAIIARSKFEDLPNSMKLTAARLLTPEQLARLNRSALDLVPQSALNSALAKVPEPVRLVLEAEAKLRQMLIDPGTTFDQLERVAVLAGLAEPGPGSRKIPLQRWSKVPEGYFVRYLPSGYSETKIQVWVPQGSPAIGKEFDPATQVAVPGNTGRQRLLQTARVRAD